ncbi:MAG: sugar phosphate isomerase/epimerase family protein [Luteitalea sp.]
MADTPHTSSASRRAFLAAGLALPAAAAMAPVAASGQAARRAAAPASARHALKIGAVTYNIAKDWDVATIIKNFTDVGLDGVELRTTHAHGVEPTLTAAQRAEVRARFEASPVKIAGLGTTCEYHAADPAVVTKNIEETKQWVALAKDLGCPSVKVRPNGLRKDVPEEQTLEQIGKALAQCGQAAADAGVRIQVEVHGTETQRIPRVVKMLQYANRHPGVWICWNSNPTDLLDGGFDKNFALLADRIGQVHMRDLYVEDYPFAHLIQTLQAMKFAGYCFAELGEPSTDGVRVLRYFRGMFRQMEGLVTPPLTA